MKKIRVNWVERWGKKEENISNIPWRKRGGSNSRKVWEKIV